ncbi:MAG TPA: hypothetical protein H9899_07400 [Candidatus Sphingomonas excrementigallinarum]|nr:hypothetical protein [Candidatus Sphingomonas excrementigallinarum]
MGWPQITYLGLTFVGLGVALAKHGQPRTGKWNVGVNLTLTAIVNAVLYAGGFYS